MPTSPESQSPYPLQPPNPEVPFHLNGIASVDWFEYIVSQVNGYFDKNPDLDETEREQIVSEIGAKLHSLHEEWHHLALYANVNNDVNTEFMGPARKELGIIRQRLIRYGIRPQLREEFIFKADLSSDGQRLFSLIKENSLELSYLETMAESEVDGFDLTVAIVELQTWGFLNEDNPGNLGLRTHSDLE